MVPLSFWWIEMKSPESTVTSGWPYNSSRNLDGLRWRVGLGEDFLSGFKRKWLQNLHMLMRVSAGEEAKAWGPTGILLWYWDLETFWGTKPVPPSERGIPFRLQAHGQCLRKHTHVCSCTCAFGVGNQMICSTLIKCLLKKDTKMVMGMEECF